MTKKRTMSSNKEVFINAVGWSLAAGFAVLCMLLASIYYDGARKYEDKLAALQDENASLTQDAGYIAEELVVCANQVDKLNEMCEVTGEAYIYRANRIFECVESLCPVNGWVKAEWGESDDE